MRFHLIDRIVELTPGKSLRAVKNLTLAEEYLADHFPTFPVMPGVLMLQTLVEAGAWLLRLSEQYAHSVIVLRDVKNIKYGSFMEPGKQMEVSVDLVERQPSLAVFKGLGVAEGSTCVNARIVLATYNLSDGARDQRIIDDLKEQCRLLCDLPGGLNAQRGGYNHAAQG
ncbi:MAG: beta-hydroxyacyl-ACP dehydratase [Planctomycetia bacterium]|nr:beta-hydroxyacyl-ACP dehydratase [Planctomycetia bacterium]